MDGTLTTTATTELESSIAHSNLRITGHCSISGLGAADVDNVTRTEHAGASGACQGDPGGPVGLEDRYASTRIKRRGHVQFAALCFCLFLAGYHDGMVIFDIGTTGPLLPAIQRHYHVNFAAVSILFVCACTGLFIGALSNVFFTEKFGFGKTIVLGAIGQVVAYSVMVPAPPFPVLVIGYAINGFCLALQDAQANGFVVSLENDSEAKMNFLHAAYGVGALTSPLVATQFAQLPHWSLHYLTILGLAITNVVFLISVFKLETQDAILVKNGQPPAETSISEQSTMRQIFGNSSVHLVAFFVLVYVGIEVTIGGWIVTFIINERGGGPNSGYISTGYFGGLTAGRMVLHYATRFVTARNSIYLYAVLCIALEFTIWLIPSLIGNAVSVSLIGFFLGPIYPVVVNQMSDILPRWLLTGSIGWIAGFGHVGSALLPFLTGALANRFGINILHPLVVAALVLVICLWALVPRGQKRLDYQPIYLP